MNLMITGADTPDAAACTTLVESAAVGDYDNVQDVGTDASTVWIGTKYVATSTATICKIEIYAEQDDATSGNVLACIYSHDAGNDSPDTAIDCSDNESIADMGAAGSPSFFPFDSGLSAAQTDTVTYWVVVNSPNNPDEFEWWKGDATTERTNSDEDGSGIWDNVNVTKSLVFKLYKQ
jgi:hypothetical protein